MNICKGVRSIFIGISFYSIFGLFLVLYGDCLERKVEEYVAELGFNELSSNYYRCYVFKFYLLRSLIVYR